MKVFPTPWLLADEIEGTPSIWTGMVCRCIAVLFRIGRNCLRLEHDCASLPCLRCCACCWRCTCCFWLQTADTPTAVAVQAVSASILTSSTGDIIEWQDRSNAGIWTSVAVDASGRYMAAAQSGGLLWYSQDKGVNWAAIANSGSRNWVSLKQHMHGSACC